MVYWTLAILVVAGCDESPLSAESPNIVVEADWPQYRGPRGNGTGQGPKLPETWPVSGLKQIWKQSIGGGYAGVSVADGRVITMDRRSEEHTSELQSRGLTSYA